MGERIPVDNKPAYSVKGYFASPRDWLNVTFITDEAAGRLEKANVQLIGVQYTDKPPGSKMRPAKLVYCRTADDHTFAYREDRIVSAGPSELAAILQRRSA